MLSGRTLQISLSLRRLCFFFHAAILKQHERQRESTLAAQFDLTSSEIKDCACKEGSQGTFVGDQNFSHYVTKE